MIQPPRHMRAMDGLFSFHLYSLAAYTSLAKSKVSCVSTHILDEHETLGV